MIIIKYRFTETKERIKVPQVPLTPVSFKAQKRFVSPFLVTRLPGCSRRMKEISRARAASFCSRHARMAPTFSSPISSLDQNFGGKST
jgi:hypothetical protein